MENDGERERLRQLEARIAKARGNEATPAEESKYSQANTAWRMVTEMVAGILLGLGIGLGLDALFGTKPFMLVLFILLGFVAGVKVMMRTAAEIQKRHEASLAGDERD